MGQEVNNGQRVVKDRNACAIQHYNFTFGLFELSSWNTNGKKNYNMWPGLVKGIFCVFQSVIQHAISDWRKLWLCHFCLIFILAFFFHYLLTAQIHLMAPCNKPWLVLRCQKVVFKHRLFNLLVDDPFVPVRCLMPRKMGEKKHLINECI